jgi:beta-lactamase regulating signal transducer with metallopeptidase domain
MSANDATWLLGVLFDASLRIGLAGAGVAAALWLLRIRGSCARHAAWTAVLMAMLAMPLLPRLLPPIEVPAGVMAVTVPDWRGASDAAGRQARVGEPRAPAAATTPAVEGVAPPASSAPTSAAPPATASSGPSLSVIAATAWMLVGMALLTRLFAGWLATRRLLRRALPVALPDDTLVLESSDLAAPVTCGLLRPRVVLPRVWRTWPDAALAAVLAHERAHVRRRDPLVSALARLNRCIFWFHPLAWWLDRTLARSAEHACDDEAVRASGDAVAYADTLVGMADAVRLRGARVAWLAAGVDGAGGLGERIDRVLTGPSPARLSTSRALALAAACAAAIGVAAACQRTLAELEPDPELAAELEERHAGQELFVEARAMSATEARALEAAVAADPRDIESRHRLLVWYRWTAPNIVGWDEALAGARAHKIWLVEHEPMHEVTGRWGRVDAELDSEGSQRARALWLAHAARPDASARLLGRAASFVQDAIPGEAERLLLLARARDPENRETNLPGRATWSGALGYLYGRVIADPAADPETREAFHGALETTTDARVLTAAGSHLLARTRRVIAEREPTPPIDADTVGRAYIARALTLEPDLQEARDVLMRHDTTRHFDDLAFSLRDTRREGRSADDVIDALPIDDQLAMLSRQATEAYLRGEAADYYRGDQDSAAEAWNRSRSLAERVLELAQQHPESEWSSPATFAAHMALGTLAVREGSREGALAHLQAGATVPRSPRLATGGWFSLEARLVHTLIKYGERESIVDFLTRTSALDFQDADRRQEDAAALREGRMPANYQRRLFSEAQAAAEQPAAGGS